MLPPDLRSAEAETLTAVRSALAAEPRGRWTVEWRFEGLRLLAPALRLAGALLTEAGQGRLLFADEGAAALARRESEILAPRIASYGDERRRQGDDAGINGGEGGGAACEEAGGEGLLLLVAPSQAEYDLVEALCGAHRGAVVLLNPNLEDAAVGIGSVARQRRKGFLSTWQTAYALLPDAESALRRAHPGEWELYRLDPDGYRLVRSFERRPDGESRAEALAGTGGVGLAGQLRGLNDLLEGLQR
ncbi:MAG: DUF1995 family protein [Cyanobium sp. 49614_E6]|nr:DUF1995 family protein [Cyanobium sp. 49614_E6]